MILNSWDAPLLPALKAANPNLKALVYKNLSFTVSYGCSGGVDLPYQSTGVGYCDANSNHPDWFLTSPAGGRLNSRELRAGVDDGRRQPGLPGEVALERPRRRPLGRLGRRLHGRHQRRHVLAPERPDDRQVPDRRRLARRHSQHARDRRARAQVGRAASRSRTSPRRGPPTTTRRRRGATGSSSPRAPPRSTTRSGARPAPAGSPATTGRTASSSRRSPSRRARSSSASRTRPKSDTRSMAWARANFLLFDEPASNGALMFEPSDPEAQDPYAPGWTADVGTPVGARFQVGSAWRRNFSGGTVVVNPTGSTVTVAARAAVPTRRRLLDDLGHARPDERRDPALLVRRTAAPPPPPPAAATSCRVALAERVGQRDEGRAPLDRPQRLTRRRLPQRRPQGDRRQQRRRTPTTSSASRRGRTPTRSARPAPRRARARSR